MTETLGLAVPEALEQRKAKNQQISKTSDVKSRFWRYKSLYMSLYVFLDLSNFPFFPRKLYLQPLDSLGTPIDVFCDQTESKVSLFNNLKGSECVLSVHFYCHRAAYIV